MRQTDNTRVKPQKKFHAGIPPLRHSEYYFLPKNRRFGRFCHVGDPQTHGRNCFATSYNIFYAKTMRIVKHIKISKFSKSQKCDAKLLLLILNGFARKSTLWVWAPKIDFFENIFLWRFKKHVEVIFEIFSKFWGCLTFAVEFFEDFSKNRFYAQKCQRKRSGTAIPKYVYCLRQLRLRRKTQIF